METRAANSQKRGGHCARDQEPRRRMSRRWYRLAVSLVKEVSIRRQSSQSTTTSGHRAPSRLATELRCLMLYRGDPDALNSVIGTPQFHETNQAIV